MLMLKSELQLYHDTQLRWEIENILSQYRHQVYSMEDAYRQFLRLFQGVWHDAIESTGMKKSGDAQCSACGVITDDYFILGDSISAKKILCQNCHNT